MGVKRISRSAVPVVSESDERDDSGVIFALDSSLEVIQRWLSQKRPEHYIQHRLEIQNTLLKFPFIFLCLSFIINCRLSLKRVTDLNVHYIVNEAIQSAPVKKSSFFSKTQMVVHRVVSIRDKNSTVSMAFCKELSKIFFPEYFSKILPPITF